MTDDTAILDVIQQITQYPSRGIPPALFLAALRDAGYDVVPADTATDAGWEVVPGHIAKLGRAVERLHDRLGKLTLALIYAEAGVERP